MILAHDTVRNFALVAGSVQAQLDNIVGSGLRFSAKPDWRALGQTAEWASDVIAGGEIEVAIVWGGCGPRIRLGAVPDNSIL